MIKKIIAISLVLFSLNIASAGFIYKINGIGTNLKNSFSSVNFKLGGNDFWGGVFWLESRSLNSGKNVEINGTTRTCHTMLRGLYFNPVRGTKLLPLDKETYNFLKNNGTNYSNLDFTGGFYTSCDNDAESIYGQITYKNTNNQKETNVTAGIGFEAGTNKMKNNISKSFQYYNGNYPVGYIYDDFGGGIGFVGGDYTKTKHENQISSINNGNSINSIYPYSSTSGGGGGSGRPVSTPSAGGNSSAVSAVGSVGVSQGSVNDSERENFIKQSGKRSSNESQKTSNIGKGVASIGKVLNITRKKSSQLCRGSWGNSISSDVICRKGDFILDTTNSDHINKTIIVKNGNLIITGDSMKLDNYLDVFVNEGNLKISNSINRTEITGNGQPISNGVTSGVNLQGNFIVNGLILGTDSKEFNHKLYIHGKVASLNTITSRNQSRKDLVVDRIGNGYDDYINLNNVFTWYCDAINGVGSDGVNCSSSSDNYKQTPFVTIMKQIQSKLF